jgi:hypothetical protein
MSHLNDNKDVEGIKMDAPPQDLGELHKQLDKSEIQYEEEMYQKAIEGLEKEIKEKDDRIAQLTAMCYTLARRLRNESFQDNITAVSRQQMAEMAMQSLNMTSAVWELVHQSEEQQRQQQ